MNFESSWEILVAVKNSFLGIMALEPLWSDASICVGKDPSYT